MKYTANLLNCNCNRLSANNGYIWHNSNNIAQQRAQPPIMSVKQKDYKFP